MKTAIKMYALLAYMLVIVATTAGAINFGCKSSEHFYTVMGVLNFAIGCYNAYKVWKGENPKLEK